MELIEKLGDWVNESKNIVVFTGAGVSAESGIPTYRGNDGLWEKYDPEKYANINYFYQDPSYYWNFFKEVRSPVLQKAKPNIAHKSIAKLESLGKLKSVITQNIDGLHKEAGSKNILELHGNTRMFSCIKCKTEYRMDQVNKLLEKHLPPECSKCNSLIRPQVVFFGENLNPIILSRAEKDLSQCDLFIAAGSSLVVQPAASLPLIAKNNGARLAIINIDPTPLDSIADLVINISVSEVFLKIVQGIKS
ncbi:MAG: NAD-dependent protein deacylase [Desulfobacterales bacterium]|nr:NAD-dependent protein deacylase [Desulfobacterales bacterium]